jgi:glutathione S-transferase
LMIPFMLWVRHAHPSLASVQHNQSPVIAEYYQQEAQGFAGWLDGVLKDRPWIAGDRFTVADITAVCGMDFAKLMKWRPDTSFPNIARWRAELADREAGKVAA